MILGIIFTWNFILRVLIISAMIFVVFYMLLVLIVGKYVFKFFKKINGEFNENHNRISIDMSNQIQRQKELHKAYEKQKKANDEVFNRFNKYK